MKTLRLAVLPGDGIGIEVTETTLPVFEKLGVPVDVQFGDIGWEFWKKEGNPVPERTWELIESSDATMIAAITSKPHAQAMAELSQELRETGVSYLSPVIQLRQRLGLFANVRPVFSIPGNPRQIADNMNFTVIRENTEGLYAGFDFSPIPDELFEFIQRKKGARSSWQMESPMDGAVALRLMTRDGVKRLLHFAFQCARDQGYPRVTWVDKPNVMRESGQFCLDILEEVAAEYPGIPWEVQNVDATAMWMVRDPGHFGVIVSENQFGDILSDLGAGLMGGLGLAPSANLGAEKAYFEPVHGSAPKHAGKGIVNPSAMFLTTSLTLKHHGYTDQADAIQRAVASVIEEGKVLTYDLGGNATTREMADAILARL
ncbi:isocitrate/isopropylmalate dehydrogenase family protein [Tumebacillus sp. ITR2]|uniref:Isocitrate/isopropylmalate dehydrogenase family protein n=1 Tax=Tumebacillus amylolyticus TaxID=2801339 RepID=A0ABS1J7U6_9BACL|nr:isocitrate/isopropylmalate family dehydrogenase [Tumebacillus amylolyticus]MBL0386367.1 isocitrate/isopropylmalate dehydrogenase family protein [Tumebacillus amylolyticus]